MSGLAHDFDQRDAAPVVSRCTYAPIGVRPNPSWRDLPASFFKMDPLDQANVTVRMPVGAKLNRDAAAQRQRAVVLRDLVALGQVRVEVVLSGKDRRRLDRAPERERGLDGVVDGLPVEDRQRPRQAEADWAHFGIGWGAEVRAAAAEDLRPCPQLRVNFQPDDGFVLHVTGRTLDSQNANSQKRPDIALGSWYSPSRALKAYTFGPASFTDGATSFSNVLKLSTNICASFLAWLS